MRGIAASHDLSCEKVLGSIRRTADVAGLPVVTNNGVILDAPAWAKRLHYAGAGYLFVDELTTCPPAVQATWRLGPDTTALIQPALYPDLPFTSRRPDEHLIGHDGQVGQQQHGYVRRGVGG